MILRKCKKHGKPRGHSSSPAALDPYAATMRIHREPSWPTDQLTLNRIKAIVTTTIHNSIFFFEGGWRAIRAIFKQILGSCKADFSNKGQVSVALRKINTISYHKLIWYFKA